MQDDRARCTLGFAHRDPWPEEEVSAFVEEILRKHGVPCFSKHDLGGEFRGGVFQAMLRRPRVIAVPSPPHYPKFNGKNERENGTARKRIAPTVARVFERLTQATLDRNEARPKDVLGGKTPAEIRTTAPRVTVDRDVVCSE